MKETASSLSNQKIARILDLHGIGHYEQSGHIFGIGIVGTKNADGTFNWVEEPEDMTFWTVKKLRLWLGY